MNNRESFHYSRKLSPKVKLSSPSRPFSRVKSVNPIKRKPWNKRFIYDKIPDYDSLKDKNVVSSKLQKLNNIKKGLDENYNTFQQGLFDRKKKGFIKPFNRTMSGFMPHPYGNNQIYRNKNNPTNSAVIKDYCSKSNFNINFNINDENLNNLRKLWNDLCVIGSYKELFIIIYSQLSGEEKEQLYQKEMKELKNVESDVKTLKYYVEQRNTALKELYELNMRLNNKFKFQNVNIGEELLIGISDMVQKLREITVDVCYSMKKLKNDINSVNNLSKFNFDVLSYRLKFDKNYLLKMKSELAFLKEGKAKNFFNFTDERSPFLLKASEPINNNDKDNQMRIIPIKEELKDYINDCNYYIYQELIAYQQNILAHENSFQFITPIKTANNLDLHFNQTQSNFFMDKSMLTQNNLKNSIQNDSNPFRRMNKNVNNSMNEYQEAKVTNSTNNLFKDKKYQKIQNIINQRFSVSTSKDLFNQKLMSGYIPRDIGNNFVIEDEKGNEFDNEDYDEESDNDITRKELNDLIEEKKDETTSKANHDEENIQEGDEKTENKISVLNNQKLVSNLKQEEIKKNSDKNNIDNNS